MRIEIKWEHYDEKRELHWETTDEVTMGDFIEFLEEFTKVFGFSTSIEGYLLG